MTINHKDRDLTAWDTAPGPRVPHEAKSREYGALLADLPGELKDFAVFAGEIWYSVESGEFQFVKGANQAAPEEDLADGAIIRGRN